MSLVKLLMNTMFGWALVVPNTPEKKSNNNNSGDSGKKVLAEMASVPVKVEEAAKNLPVVANPPEQVKGSPTAPVVVEKPDPKPLTPISEFSRGKKVRIPISSIKKLGVVKKPEESSQLAPK